MKKLKKVLIVLSVLLILTGAGAVGYFKIYLPMQAEWKLSLKDIDDNTIEKIDVMKNSIIEIYDNKNQLKEEIIVSDETELVLINEKDTDTDLFDTYSVTKKTGEDIKKPSYQLKPKYEPKKDFTVSISGDTRSKIKLNGNMYSRKNITVATETTYEDIIPEMNIQIDHKGIWKFTESESEVIPTDIITEDIAIQFVTYQDKNNNGIDDFTETFTVKYNTGIEETIDDVTVKWEGTINLPILKHDSMIFYEWYTDSTMKTVITEDTKITSDMTVYAKVKDINQVMNDSVENPIDRKDLALQIERIINDYNTKVDNKYNESIVKENQDRVEREQYEKENNIYNTDRQYSTEFSNTALNKLYFVTFINENSEFIYGFVAPYGRTIKVYDSNNNLSKEYAVRQHTTISLREGVLTSYNEELVNYSSEYYKINDTVYVKITPTVKNTVVEESTQE